MPGIPVLVAETNDGVGQEDTRRTVTGVYEVGDRETVVADRAT